MKKLSRRGAESAEKKLKYFFSAFSATLREIKLYKQLTAFFDKITGFF